MALVESNAAFTQRCNEIDPARNFVPALAAQNIGTFSAMAFALGTPQTPPSDQQFDALADVFGPGFTLGQTSMLRRLHFESTTLMIASVKQQVDGEAAEKADTVKTIPIAEKRQGLSSRSRLAGINISGELEPSHQLLDLAALKIQATATTGAQRPSEPGATFWRQEGHLPQLLPWWFT
jgi:hypothetical protein